MAKPLVPDSNRDMAMAPSEVRVTVLRLHADQTRNQKVLRRMAITAASVLALVAVVLSFSWSRGSRSDIWGVREAGPAGVAAAYGYPTSCLRVRISAVDPSFARADFGRPRSCSEPIAFPTALFRRLNGEWRPVLYAVSYPCPLPSVPVAVQRQLALCRS